MYPLYFTTDSLRCRFRRMYLLAFFYGTIFGLEIAAVIYLLLKP